MGRYGGCFFVYGFTGRSPYQTVDRMRREVGLSLADQTRVATAKERDEYRIVVSKTFLRFALPVDGCSRQGRCSGPRLLFPPLGVM